MHINSSDDNINDLENVIEESVTDSTNPEVEDTSTDQVASPGTDDTTAEEVTTDDTATDQVASPASGAAGVVDPAADDFAKKFGLQAQSVTGRENRIPYSRVKKIVEKNERETIAKVTKDVESKFAPQLTEYQTKVKDYEERLTRVGQFEHILENDPKTFLGMLSQIPVYKEFFDYVAQAANQQQAPQQEQPFLDSTGMPQPDQTLSDGSKVYSMEGLAKRDEWLARQIEGRAVQQAEERMAQRYAPIEQAWKSQEQLARIAPVVDKQIAEARTWPNFDELESEIVAILKADKSVSLERAYMQAYQKNVVPKLSTDRNAIRSEILAEIKKKPVSSGAPVNSVKPNTSQQSGPRTMEEIIAASIAEAGIK